MPVRLKGIDPRRFSDTAISPDGDTASTSAFVSPKGRDSGLSSRETNTSMGRPSQFAEYRIVCPSGANRAEPIAPRRNVSWWKVGGGTYPARLPVQ